MFLGGVPVCQLVANSVVGSPCRAEPLAMRAVARWPVGVETGGDFDAQNVEVARRGDSLAADVEVSGCRWVGVPSELLAMEALAVFLQGGLELADDGLEALHTRRVDDDIINPDEWGMGTSCAARWWSGEGEHQEEAPLNPTEERLPEDAREDGPQEEGGVGDTLRACLCRR